MIGKGIDIGVACHTHLRWGYTADTILQVADDTRCDLIIMGTPSLRRWQRVMQPNAVKRVSTRARQPVLVIKAP
jgi:nucleotide-binding universal stress UspA family protein